MNHNIATADLDQSPEWIGKTDCPPKPTVSVRSVSFTTAIPEPSEAEIAIAAQYTATDWQQAWEDQPENITWVLENIIEAGTLNSIYSQPGVGKSLFCLEQAALIAQTGVHVLYIDNENRTRDHVERLTKMGLNPADIPALHMLSFAKLPNLETREGGEHVLALVKYHHAEVLVIDTTSRFVENDENAANTYIDLNRNTFIPLKGIGVTVIQLDHPGKDLKRGRRGSSAKQGDVDTEWELTPTPDSGNEFILTNKKDRCGHVPGKLKITRKTDPELWHDIEVAGNVRQSKDAEQEIKDLIVTLDGLGIPRNAGRPAVVTALKAANMPVNTDRIREAVKLRKAA